MISKENFIKYMNELKRLSDTGYELTKVLRKISSDGEIYFDKHESLIVNILQDAFDDKENDWIGYALYELDWFKNFKDGMIIGVDGESIQLRDAVDLYDILVENMEYEIKRNNI